MALLERQMQRPSPDILVTEVREESPIHAGEQPQFRALCSRSAHSTSTYITALLPPEGLLSRSADDETDAPSASPGRPASACRGASSAQPPRPRPLASGPRAPLAGLPAALSPVRGGKGGPWLAEYSGLKKGDGAWTLCACVCMSVCLCEKKCVKFGSVYV